MVKLAVDGNLSQQAVLLLIFLAQPIECIADPLHRYPVARTHPGNFSDLRVRIARTAGDYNLANFRLWSRVYDKDDRNLLSLRISLLFGLDLRAVIPILLKQCLDA